MKRSKLLVAAAVVVLSLGLSACASSTGDVIAPVVMDANDLQGATVDLVVGQVLDINTGSLPVDSYTGTVEDPKVAEFVPGREESSATFNPGVTALSEGTTEVVMSNSTGGIQDLTFTVEVTPK